MVDKGVDLSLHSNCNPQIKYWKLILNIKYPSLYECLFCDYDKASVEGIKKSIESVSWELRWSNKSAHKQISTFDKTLMSIFSSITPYKLIIFDDRNPSPPLPFSLPLPNGWIILLKVKLMGKPTYRVYTFVKNGYKFSDYLYFQRAKNLVPEIIAEKKQYYHDNLAWTLNNPTSYKK